MKYLKKYWEKATARYILESLKGLKVSRVNIVLHAVYSVHYGITRDMGHIILIKITVH